MKGLWIGKAVVIGGLLLGLGSRLESEAGAKGPEGILYFFTTPEAEGGPEGAKKAIAFLRKHPGQLKLRPVLLAQDWKLLQAVTEKSPITRTLKELEAAGKPGTLDIPLYDEEGLVLAERWGLRSVPAFVLVLGGHAHRLSGPGSDLEELWECAKCPMTSVDP